MSNCAVCHKPVKSGIVIHSECMEMLQKAQQVDDKPLTIEELRRMVGEPVWVESPGVREYGRYGIVAGVDTESMELYLESDFTCSDYGKTWVAYRRKPNDWISVNDRNPNNEELKRSECFEFLCRVIIPEKGGNVCKKALVIKYDILDKQWECDGMIVTHWMPLPAPPEVE